MLWIFSPEKPDSRAEHSTFLTLTTNRIVSPPAMNQGFRQTYNNNNNNNNIYLFIYLFTANVLSTDGRDSQFPDNDGRDGP
jgi:hypothetical protein